ncbi:hypothetical protein CF095_13530 [Clostridium botulinum]
MNSTNFDYLYHYTDIDTLALILKNRTIRFNSLQNVDDLEEKESEEFPGLCKYTFVSCWTDDLEENIPLWKLYTNMKGVRIKLPKYPFKKYYITDNQEYTYINPNEYKNYDFIIDPSVRFLKINYVDDNMVCKKISSYNNGNCLEIDAENVGKIKRKSWDFQKECRYIINIIPISQDDIAKGTLVEAFERNICINHSNLPINYYDLEIDEDKFNNMEITLGPGVTKGDRITVKNLVKEYNPKAVIKESVLKDKIML